MLFFGEALEMEMAVLAVAMVEHHCQSAKAELVGGTRNVREAFFINKLSLCLFVC